MDSAWKSVMFQTRDSKWRTQSFPWRVSPLSGLRFVQLKEIYADFADRFVTRYRRYDWRFPTRRSYFRVLHNARHKISGSWLSKLAGFDKTNSIADTRTHTCDVFQLARCARETHLLSISDSNRGVFHGVPDVLAARRIALCLAWRF